MPIAIPDGYITRPAAKDVYNRSQRALERDVEVALAISDIEELAHWKLVTKDGAQRSGEDVTTELVKKLHTDGMVPTWCVSESHLEKKYGRKGDPKPASKGKAFSTGDVKSPSQTSSAADERHTHENTPSGKETNPGETLPDDAAFLKERIHILEKEKADERARHDKVVERLFNQLDVKDKQISAWDEVTQGLTKGLATGQITPRLVGQPGVPTDRPNEDEGRNVSDADVVEPADSDGRSEEGSVAKENSKAEKNEKTRSTRKRSKAAAKNPRWYETPTLNRIVSRFRSR